MQVTDFVKALNAEFFTGVPDSLLQPLCNYLIDRFGISRQHIIAANEGNCTAIAAGYHLATGKIPVVYMQNSGIGNAVNPVASLLNNKVYAIPTIFIVGWRGEPGVKDEPQHIFQGEITVPLLELLDIHTYTVTPHSVVQEIEYCMKEFRKRLAEGKSVAFVMKRGALHYENPGSYGNQYTLMREEIIRHIVAFSGEDLVVCTTGKTGRELFELREANQQTHEQDFLTVGAMGHCSSIALGIALHKPEQKVWCIDGDGAALMHMGAMAVLGAQKPNNLIHIVINNGAHESVGGIPTVAEQINLPSIAKNCGYSDAEAVCDFSELDNALQKAKECQSLCFIEVKAAIGARRDLGRPTVSAVENKEKFMQRIKGKDELNDCLRDTTERYEGVEAKSMKLAVTFKE